MFRVRLAPPIRARFQFGDLAVLALLALLIYSIGITAREWKSSYLAATEIHLSSRSLLTYSILSFSRASLAYFLSLCFTLTFGYAAAKSRFAETLILPLLDIGQSIPVLGFLPGLVLGLVSLFPRSKFGLELACVLMIFTGQVWNMTFSFLSSLKSVPEHLYEMAKNSGLSKSKIFLRIELPCAATGLAWNSLMSIAGGWFFLTVCEAFILGEKNFRLRGLGSYMSVAIEQHNHQAMTFGILAMMSMIVLSDFLIWRPIIAWSAKFRLSESFEETPSIPFMTLLFRSSWLTHRFNLLLGNLSSLFSHLTWRPGRARSAKRFQARFHHQDLTPTHSNRELISKLILSALGLWVGAHLLHQLKGLHWSDWSEILMSAAFTFTRVLCSVAIGTLWALPAGVLIGLSPKLTRILQPLIQMGAAFPAPMLYPFALSLFAILHLPINFAATLLMLLGVQWYILFNVLAGAVTISRDLRDSFRLIGVSHYSIWTKLYLPSVFPYLVTGWITAAGGAWNASIVAEYISTTHPPLLARGLGSLMSLSTAQGHYSMLIACLIVMVSTVTLLNRLFWAKLYTYAETRFRFER